MSALEQDRAAGTGDAIGDAVAEAVRRAMREVDRVRLALLLDAAAADADGGDRHSDSDSDGIVVDLTGDLPVVEGVEGVEGVELDPYDVLGVGRDAPWEVLVAARNELLRTWHPDLRAGHPDLRASSDSDDDMLMVINAAFAELRIRRGR